MFHTGEEVFGILSAHVLDSEGGIRKGNYIARSMDGRHIIAIKGLSGKFTHKFMAKVTRSLTKARVYRVTQLDNYLDKNRDIMREEEEDKLAAIANTLEDWPNDSWHPEIFKDDWMYRARELSDGREDIPF